MTDTKSFFESVGRIKHGAPREILASYASTYPVARALMEAPDDALAEIWDIAAPTIQGAPLWAKLPAPIKRFYHVTEWDKLPKVEWLIDLIPSTGITVFYGTEGTGKSLLGLRLANECAGQGHPALYMPYEDTPVMYVRQTAHDTRYPREQSTEYPLWLMAVDQPILNQEGVSASFASHLREAGSNRRSSSSTRSAPAPMP